MKRLFSLTLTLIVALLAFASCDVPQSDDHNHDEMYTIEVAFEQKVEDGKHNADVKLNKVTFKDNEALTEAVNNIIYEPFYSRYIEYLESVPVDFNFFRGENMIYESDELLSVAALSYRQGTYVVFPHIDGAVVDLKNGTLLSKEELLELFDTSYSDVFEEVRKILPGKYETNSPMIVCDIIDSYLNSKGDLITIFSTDHLNVDMPANPTLYYNVTTKAICTHPVAESFEELEALFNSLPEDYVFDQEKYDEYYESYDRITARMPKYKLDVSEIENELVEQLEYGYSAGKEVTVVIGTVTETNQYLWVNDEKMSPTDRDLLYTTFTFVMPDRDVKLRIEEKSVDIPLAPPDISIEPDDTLTETDVEQIALEHCKHNYDYVETTYDSDNKKWQVGFWENGAKLAAQTVTIDSEGNLLGTWFAE